MQNLVILLDMISARNTLRLFSLSALLVFVMLVVGMTIVLLTAPLAQASSRIKDVVTVEGIRENQLIGYGLVVGLNGTGDKLNNSVFTQRSLASFLERLGINTADVDLKVNNVAAVTVTAELPAFSRNGGRLDVRVSALGDSKSLRGGTLLATPLMGADGNVYAVAQGVISIEGFEAKGDSASITKGVPTNGYISNGAIVEKEIAFDLNKMETMKLALRNPDIATAARIAEAINKELGDDSAKMTDPGTVEVAIPSSQKGAVAQLLAQIEQLTITPDQSARIVIEESSGTIVMNENVKLDTVAVAQGNLVIRIRETPQVSQPGVLAPKGAETVVTSQTDIAVDEGGDKKMTIMKNTATLKELVDGLNALGVGPRDMITILQTIKHAGALQADIEIR